MQTIFDLVDAVKVARRDNADAFGVHYFSASNPANRHYVVLRSEAELENLKAFHREYDFKFYVVAE
jgi:hypothetical protein